MVNLTVLPARNVRGDENEMLSRRRSHRTWGIRYGRSREEVKQRGEPSGLQELHELALRTVKLMEKHGTDTPQSYNEAMDLLRQQHNMNFLLLCEKCGGSHSSDELSAPER